MSTPVVKFLRRKVEEWFGRWQEGPEPPHRLREIAVVFAEMHPKATREQWLEFACRHADEAYRVGYIRGYEHVERDPEPRDFTPEQLAAQVDPDWRWAPDIRLTDPLGVVQGEPAPGQEITQDMLDDIARRTT